MTQSLAEQLADLRSRVSEALAEELAGEGDDDDWERLRWDWRFWGRPEQFAPTGPWTFWLMLAGRGFGKTRAGSEAVREIVATGEVEHVGLVAKTPADARDVMIEGESGILAVSPPGERPLWEPSKRRLTWPNGARATVYSGENPDQLRGPNHQLVWCDELCAWQYPGEAWDNLAFGLRIPWRGGGGARAIITTTPRPIRALRDVLALEGCAVTRGSTYENRGNLAANFLRQMLGRYEGTRLGRQELLAELLEDVVGALWTRETIERLRCARPPDDALERIVVAVDPAVSSGEDSCETGIVVAARGEDKHGYVLADRSCRLPPAGWARRAVEAAEEFGADCIVAEANNGGEMVALTIRTVDPRVRVKLVHASRGKRARAEPVSALYEQGRVHHVGGFAQLEDQMCSYTGMRGGEASPDRLDALVWALSELSVSGRPRFTLG